VAPEYGYCHQAGYDTKTVSDRTVCQEIYSSRCAVCVMPGGNEIEESKLMNLSFSEATCGDGACAPFFENYSLCQADCPSGGRDRYCDRVQDGIVDPDCPAGEDPDYRPQIFLPLIMRP
jgi:putative hemolysin